MPAGKPVIIVGGGIGGLAAALALARQGVAVKVLEQSSVLGEIGAGMQLGPNAFAAFEDLGLGDLARDLAVLTDEMVMHDALDETLVGRIPVGAEFIKRFRNPYAVIHRADAHLALLAAARDSSLVEVQTDCQVEQVVHSADHVVVTDASGQAHRGVAVVAADGIKSVVRDTYVGDQARVSGHVVYRAVVDRADFPTDLAWNAASIWVGPNCHLVHYPLRGGEQFNVVVTFHSDQVESWGVTDGNRDELNRYFAQVCPRARQLLDLPKSWKRWATADRDPIERWTFGRITLLGDAAHPMLQYLAQGACMALEDAVTLGRSVARYPGQYEQAFELYQRSRVTRCARVVLSARMIGQLFHASGVERLVRNDLWKDRKPQRFYDAMEWLYDWHPDRCLGR